MSAYDDEFRKGGDDDMDEEIEDDDHSLSGTESNYSHNSDNLSDNDNDDNDEFMDDEGDGEDENDKEGEGDDNNSDSDASEIHVNRALTKGKQKKANDKKNDQKNDQKANKKKNQSRPLAEDDDDDMENYLQKFDVAAHQQVLNKHHPELASISPQEMYALAKIVRDNNGKIIDPLHTTIPFLTKYERTHVIGVRASQLDNGSPPFIELADNIIDSHTIALMEFNAKQIPFIIARPMPAGGVEYWHLNDLERLF